MYKQGDGPSLMGVGERERAGYKGGSGDTNIRVPSFKIAEIMEYFLFLISLRAYLLANRGENQIINVVG